MDVKKLAKEMVAYYEFTRAAGHTFTMLEGAKNVDCIIIAHNLRMAEIFKRMEFSGGKRRPLDVISINSLHKLRGASKPVVFDNAALFEIFKHIVDEDKQQGKKHGWCSRIRKWLSR